MRKIVVAMLAAGLLVGSLAAPATAGRKTFKKPYNFGPLSPNPVLTDVDPNGCGGDASQEGVHKQTYKYTTPRHRRTGTLSFTLDEFTGDWDLYVYKGSSVIASSTTDNTAQAFEKVLGIRLRKRTTVSIVACNWSGGPTAKGHLVYKYRSRG